MGSYKSSLLLPYCPAFYQCINFCCLSLAGLPAGQHAGISFTQQSAVPYQISHLSVQHVAVVGEKPICQFYIALVVMHFDFQFYLLWAT